jgi:hypothetical protein
MLWLLFLVLTPYITKLLTEGGDAGFVLRFGLHALAQAGGCASVAELNHSLDQERRLRRRWRAPSLL